MSKIYISYCPLNDAKNSRDFQWCEYDFNRIHELTSSNNYSNIIWKDGIRKAGNFLGVNWLSLDIDSGLSLEVAKALLGDYGEVCIVTTRSHQLSTKSGKIVVPTDHFRIMIKLDEPITDYDTYRTVITNLIEQFQADPACKDGARFYYGNPKQEVWYS